LVISTLIMLCRGLRGHAAISGTSFLLLVGSINIRSVSGSHPPQRWRRHVNPSLTGGERRGFLNRFFRSGSKLRRGSRCRLRGPLRWRMSLPDWNGVGSVSSRTSKLLNGRVYASDHRKGRRTTGFRQHARHCRATLRPLATACTSSRGAPGLLDLQCFVSPTSRPASST
jgi:hypothetical protein